MSRGRQYIQFEGYFAQSVLGIFRIIRGFADLRDLAAVSVLYEMTGHETQPRRVIGYQRAFNEKHAQDIKNTLSKAITVLFRRWLSRPVFRQIQWMPTGGLYWRWQQKHPIHQKMYEAIAASEIIVCDLTGHCPNVYVEAGYALKHHEQNRLIYFFEPQNTDDRVPFDLNTFKYVEVSQAAEIPGKLKLELIAILQDAGAVINGGTS